MNTKVLIDSIVQQTTILIAQLSTASGIRAPLAHVADQVFLKLSREIEAQGVGRRVVADMFGMAIRSYQKKVQRLAESETETGTTLWHAVLKVLLEKSMARHDLVSHFRRDPEREVRAVLHDLVASGFVFRTGRGDKTLYGVTSAADRQLLQESSEVDSLAHVLWLEVQNEDPLERARLLERFTEQGEAAVNALAELLADGRLTQTGSQLSAANFTVPLGSECGWEAAVLDHYQTMVRAIGAKLDRPRSAAEDQVGGSTLRFSIYQGHPAEKRVLTLLKKVRELTLPLWDEVSTYNETHPVPAEAQQVSFYFGQYSAEQSTVESEES